jgi:hypothetical protein
MMMKHLMLLVVGLTLVSSPAFAAAKTVRHCVDKDNKEITLAGVAGKTPVAQCKTAGGKWVRVKAAKSTTTTSTTTKKK